MRALRSVAQQETLVCWGAYHYFKDRQPIGITEEWSIHRLPDDTKVIRADVDARRVSDAPDLLTHLVRDPDGRPQELLLQYRRGSLFAKATYTFHRGDVVLTRDVSELSTRRETIEVASNYGVDFHTAIARDYVWQGYPNYMQGDAYAMSVFMVVVQTEEVSDLLSGNAVRVNVQPLEAASLTIPCGEYTAVRRYEVTGSDGQKAIGWYDERGIPLRWSLPDEELELVLVRYRYQETEEETTTE